MDAAAFTKRPIRIYFITNIIPHYRVSFYQKISDLEPYELTVFHGYPELDSGSRVERNKKYKFRNLPVTSKFINISRFEIVWQNKIMSRIFKKRPDIIILSGTSGMITNWFILFWTRITKIKTLMWACGWESQNINSFHYQMKKILLKIYFRFPNEILVYSTKAKKYLQTLGVPRNKIQVCHNGIEIEGTERIYSVIENKGRVLRSKEKTLGEVVFLYVGALLKEKQVDILLKAFRRIENKRKSSLWIVGDGPYKRELISLSGKLGLKNIKFWGRIVEDVDSYFSAADFFVLPGIGGLALNQAMYWMTPCICSEADGTEEDLVIEGSTGFRFKKNDVYDLACVMLKAADIKDTPKMRMLRENCRGLIKKRSNVDHMVSIFYSAINRLTNQGYYLKK